MVVVVEPRRVPANCQVEIESSCSTEKKKLVDLMEIREHVRQRAESCDRKTSTQSCHFFKFTKRKQIRVTSSTSPLPSSSPLTHSMDSARFCYSLLVTAKSGAETKYRPTRTYVAISSEDVDVAASFHITAILRSSPP